MLLLLLLWLTNLCDASWPLPGGNWMRNGLQLGARPLGWPGAIPTLKWATELQYSRGHVAGPVTSPDGKMLFVQVGGDLLAVAADDGRVLWRKKVAATGETSAPAVSVDGSMIFLITEENNALHAFGVVDGVALWSYEVGHCHQNILASWSPVMSPVGDVIFVTSPLGSTLHAIETMNGTATWVSDLRADGSLTISSHPAISPDGSVIFVATTVPYQEQSSRLVAVDATTGGIVWIYAAKETQGYWMGPMPVASPDGLAVYIGTKNNYLYAVNASDGSLLWKFADVASFSPVAVSADSTKVYAPGSKILHAIDADTGQEKWRFGPYNFLRQLDSDSFAASHLTGASLSGDDATIFVATWGCYDISPGPAFYDYNQVYALDAASGKVKWAYPAEPPSSPQSPPNPYLPPPRPMPEQQYLDSVSYVAISNDGTTLFMAEGESFMGDNSLQKYSRPVYLRAVEIIGCNVSAFLPHGQKYAGNCSLDYQGGLPNGGECQPGCKPGTKPFHAGKLKCSFGGVLSSAICLPGACDSSGVTVGHGGPGTCALYGVALPSGGFCTPSCDEGYYGFGNVTCYEEVLRNFFTCEPKPCQTSGALRGFSPGSCPPSLPHNKSCTPACPDGYGIRGGLSCSFGVISGEFSCEQGWCDLYVILHRPGVINTCGDSIRGGQTCNSTCSTGYIAVGTIECLVGGILHSNFSCIEKSCPDLIEAPTYGGVGNCTGELAGGQACTPTCNLGFKPLGQVRCVEGRIFTTFQCLPMTEVELFATTTMVLGGHTATAIAFGGSSTTKKVPDVNSGVDSNGPSYTMPWATTTASSLGPNRGVTINSAITPRLSGVVGVVVLALALCGPLASE